MEVFHSLVRLCCIRQIRTYQCISAVSSTTVLDIYFCWPLFVWAWSAERIMIFNYFFFFCRSI